MLKCLSAKKWFTFKTLMGEENKDSCVQKLVMKSSKSKQPPESKAPTLTFECEYCHKVFTTKFNLTRHKRTKHYEVLNKPMTCIICNKILPSKRELLTHQNEHKFKCNLCKKQFSKESNLKRHKNQNKD